MLIASSLLAADASPKDDVTAAAAALGSQKNYSWRTTVEAGNNSAFKPGPTEGKTEKDGCSALTMTFNPSSPLAAVASSMSGESKIRWIEYRTSSSSSINRSLLIFAEGK